MSEPNCASAPEAHGVRPANPQERWLRWTQLVVVCTAMVIAANRVDSAESWVTRYPTIAQQTNAACKANELIQCEQGLRSLDLLLLGRPDIRCRLAIIEAKRDERAMALENLEICARSGLEFPQLAEEPALRGLSGSPAFTRIEAEYRRGSVPQENHTLQFTLNDPDLLAEDVVADPLDGSFLISSVHLRKIVRVAPDRTMSDFLTTKDVPLWGVFALALDARRRVFWATTTAVLQSPPYTQADDGHSSVLRLSLVSKQVLRRYELTDAEPHEFGDMTLGASGTAYVSDGRGGGIYRIAPDQDDRLIALVPPGTFRSPQTPAVIEGEHLLLVPDYTRGIGRVDLRQGAVTWLQHPPELSLAGIDGMYILGRTLVAVQNGANPERVLVMTLDAKFRSVSQWRVALARAPGLGDPTHGLFAGGDFLVLVNSGWDRADAEGAFRNDSRAAPAQIWRIPLAEVPRLAR